jgi:hypothetical protein
MKYRTEIDHCGGRLEIVKGFAIHNHLFAQSSSSGIESRELAPGKGVKVPAKSLPAEEGLGELCKVLGVVCACVVTLPTPAAAPSENILVPDGVDNSILEHSRT